MSITPRQKRWLKQQVHHLKPVVLIGQHGLGESVLAELEVALAHHELLKIRISVGDREERDAILATIGERTGAALISRIGNVAALYRPNPRKRDPLVLPRD
ncbi:MAG: YhbY family RNA-binding protein [Chromatiaceae bacterium]|nr:YhbY family RNA-binding protein [Chromatiaceae bacterium]